MRDTRLTLWPEQTAYYPLVNSWAYIKQASVLDFSQCVEIQSCGLAASALLVNWLFKRLNNHEYERKEQQSQLHIFEDLSIRKNKEIPAKVSISEIVSHNNANIMKICHNLGFFECIKKNMQEKTYSVFQHEKKNVEPIVNGQNLSFPIFMIDYDRYKHRSRDMLDDFFEYSSKIFDSIFRNNIDRGNQLNHILNSVVKLKRMC